MKNKFHIIWDWNGTLIDDVMQNIESINILMKKRGIKTTTKNQYKNNFCFPVINYYKHLGFDFEKENFENVSEEFINVYNELRWKCSLHKNAKEIIETLSQNSFSHSILSAYKENTLIEMVEKFLDTSTFIEIAGLKDNFAHSKIQRGFEHIKNINLPKENIFMIGDTLHDFEVAYALGVSPILISHGHHSFEKLSSSGAKVVRNFEELLKILTL